MIKKIIVIVVLCLFISVCFASTTREDLYHKFGPMLIEAVCLVVKDEINLLRVEAGLPVRTNEQLINAIDSKLETIEKYKWMDIQ